MQWNSNRKNHRPLREIEFSLAGHLVLNAGANQNIDPAYSSKVCFMVATMAGNITATVNKDSRARPMSGLLLYGKCTTVSFNLPPEGSA